MSWVLIYSKVTLGIAKWHTSECSMYARVLHLGSQWQVLTIMSLSDGTQHLFLGSSSQLWPRVTALYLQRFFFSIKDAWPEHVCVCFSGKFPQSSGESLETMRWHVVTPGVTATSFRWHWWHRWPAVHMCELVGQIWNYIHYLRSIDSVGWGSIL